MSVMTTGRGMAAYEDKTTIGIEEGKGADQRCSKPLWTHLEIVL